MISGGDVNDLQLEDVEDYATDYPPAGFPKADENIHVSSGEDYSKKRTPKIVELVKANKWIAGVVFLMAIILIAIIAIASGPSDNGSNTLIDDSNNAQNSDEERVHQPPITIDPQSLDPEITEPLLSTLQSLHERHGLDASVLGPSAGDTPQNKAFYWLATDAHLDSLDHTQVSQRYALAVFYYATNGVPNEFATEVRPWVSAHLWLSKAHACEWKGVVCNSQQHVEEISLERNNLTGSLPKELAILGEKLTSLDLTSNLIHMEGDAFEAFSALENLQTLLMDDNYLVYKKGLPAQFKNMVNLEKLRLSYNLLSGVLEADHKVLDKMTKLTHLELESNFLSGTMPSIIGEMSNLVYLYMRRNDMSYTLDFLTTGKLTNLFALWLDNNEVKGTIPTEIGQLENLASISITNSSLFGTIPTEFGNLSGLKRLWLYDNDLTGPIPAALDNLAELQVLELHHNQLQGQMPRGICQIIEDSQYEYKSLTSDCNSLVTCALYDCCTECYD